MRKKSILLFIMIFSLWSSVAFAEENDDNRWFWISSNEKFSTYVDTQTIKYHPEIDMCDMWIKFDSQPEGKYIVEHINLSFKNNIINVYDYIEYSYDKANPVTNTLNLNGRSFTIAPDTVSEDLKQIKVISDPKKRLRVDINEVVLILPPFGLKVFSNEKTISVPLEKL